MKRFGVNIRQIENGWLVSKTDNDFNEKTWYAKDKSELKTMIESKTKV